MPALGGAMGAIAMPGSAATATSNAAATTNPPGDGAQERAPGMKTGM